MSESLKNMIVDVPSRNPYVIVEERGKGFVPTLLPGHMFSLNIDLPFVVNEGNLPLNRYEYQNQKDDRFFLAKEPYYDEEPIGLNLRLESNEYVSILNFKVIPPNYRYFILEKYYQLAKTAIRVGYEEDLSKEKMELRDRIRENNYMVPFLGVTKTLMENVTGIDLSFAINKYNISTIRNAKLLDWDSLPDIAKMNVSERGLTFNPGAGRLEGMFNTFESRI